MNSSALALLREHPLIFFTGGTALRELSRCFAARGCHTTHLVTTFDSGGSTARLRAAFAMPAVGDLRNRLVALADTKACGLPLVRCLETRLPKDGDPEVLRNDLRAIARTDHTVWQGMGSATALCLQSCLDTFLSAMPENFDAREASLGNICMAGKYLQEHRSLSAVMGLFSRLLHIQGEVLPIVEESLHLAARLRDGTLLVGQHHFKDLASPIVRFFLTVSEPDRAERGTATPVACRPRAATPALARLREAGLVCYPMGSFFSSVLANLLAEGTGHIIADLSCPKVFIPNTGTDRELLGQSLTDQLGMLIDTLRKDAPGARARDLVSHVLIDTKNGQYAGDLPALRLWAENLGVELLDCDIVEAHGCAHDPHRTAHALLRLLGME